MLTRLGIALGLWTLAAVPIALVVGRMLATADRTARPAPGAAHRLLPRPGRRRRRALVAAGVAATVGLATQVAVALEHLSADDRSQASERPRPVSVGAPADERPVVPLHPSVGPEPPDAPSASDVEVEPAAPAGEPTRPVADAVTATGRSFLAELHDVLADSLDALGERQLSGG